MENIVAVALHLEKGRRRYFLTWGRIQDPVDGAALEAIVLKAAPVFDLGGRPTRARLCDTLQEASKEPYFYEALFDLARQPVPTGRGYRAWTKRMNARMKQGRELHYLGRAR